ncbi:MAG TPA: hypothetical protein VN641_10385 [Urbifossiella sp.]|nr:hypothetical protein [Urbifossiella sp.]
MLALLTVLGAAFIYSLGLVGHRIEAILQENYRSVDAMTGLNEAADRIDWNSKPINLAQARVSYSRGMPSSKSRIALEMISHASSRG